MKTSTSPLCIIVAWNGVAKHSIPCGSGTMDVSGYLGYLGYLGTFSLDLLVLERVLSGLSSPKTSESMDTD